MCVAAGWVAGTVLSLVPHIAYWPPRWIRTEMEDFPAIALLGAGYVVTLPFFTLALFSVRKRDNTITAVSVSVGWLLFLAL